MKVEVVVHLELENNPDLDGYIGVFVNEALINHQHNTHSWNPMYKNIKTANTKKVKEVK